MGGGGGGGSVELVQCKVCGVSCMLLFGNKKGGGGVKWEKVAGAGAGAVEKVVVVLKVDLHCDKCAGKVRSAVRRFSGVEEVKEEGGLVELIVEGKVNPEQLRAKVEEKTKTKVDLLSVSPTVTAGDKSAAGSGKPVTVVLRTLLHCESCVHKCKKVVRSQQGVQNVIIEKERGLTYAVTVTGTMDVDRLLRRTQSKLGRKVVVFTPPPKPAQPPPAQQAKKIDHDKEGGHGKAKDKEKAEAADGKNTTTDKKLPAAAAPAAKAEVKTAKEVQAEPRKEADVGGEVGDDIVEKKRLGEYMEGYLGYHVYSVYPPQQFSDENPNACSVM